MKKDSPTPSCLARPIPLRWTMGAILSGHSRFNVTTLTAAPAGAGKTWSQKITPEKPKETLWRGTVRRYEEYQEQREQARLSKIHGQFVRIAKEEHERLHYYIGKTIDAVIPKNKAIHIHALFDCFRLVSDTRPDLIETFLNAALKRSKDRQLIAFMATLRHVNTNEVAVRVALTHDNACGHNRSFLLNWAVQVCLETGNPKWLTFIHHAGNKPTCSCVREWHPMRTWAEHVGRLDNMVVDRWIQHTLHALNEIDVRPDQRLRFQSSDGQREHESYPNALAMACGWHDQGHINQQPILALLDFGMPWADLDQGEGGAAQAIRSHPAWRKQHLAAGIGQNMGALAQEADRRPL